MSDAPDVNEFGHECWIVETSKDGERWRFFGRAWKRPGEARAVACGAAVRAIPPRRREGWRGPFESAEPRPVTLLQMEDGVRAELWPDERHLGLPMLLPGGEIGTLLRFEHTEDPEGWTYALEFRGSPG